MYTSSFQQNFVVGSNTVAHACQPRNGISQNRVELYEQILESGAEREAVSVSSFKISSEQYQLFCDFFNRFKPLINRKLNYYKGSSEILDDLLQEGYLALWQTIFNCKRLNTLNKDVRLAINSRMQQFWREQIKFSNSTSPIIEEPSFIDHSVEEIEIVEELLKAINTLSKKRKEIVLQRYRLINEPSKHRSLCSKRTRQADSLLLKSSLLELASHPSVISLHNS